MFQEQIIMNKRKTWLVVTLYFVMFLMIGWGFGYLVWRHTWIGLIGAVIVGGIYILFMIKHSTSIVMKMNHAREIKSVDEYPMLYHIVEDMALVAQVPMPKIYVIDNPSPNAFATGMSPKQSAVAATTGLLNLLTREEIEGVMAHEFAHIKNYDVRLQTIAVALGAVIGLMSQFGGRAMLFGSSNRSSQQQSNRTEGSSGVINMILMIASVLLMILGPILATIMQYAISRNREYLADATAVALTRNPQGLIQALSKISNAPGMSVDEQSAALYIVNPLKKKEKDSWFSTHPATSNRIERLRQM